MNCNCWNHYQFWFDKNSESLPHMIRYNTRAVATLVTFHEILVGSYGLKHHLYQQLVTYNINPTYNHVHDRCPCPTCRAGTLKSSITQISVCWINDQNAEARNHPSQTLKNSQGLSGVGFSTHRELLHPKNMGKFWKPKNSARFLFKKRLENRRFRGWKGVFVDTLKLAEMILEMRRFAGINIKRWCQQKKTGSNGKHRQQKTESQQGNTTTKKTCYHFRGHNYRTNNFMCNSTFSGSSSHEQRIFGWFFVLTWGDEPPYIVATPWEPQVHPLMRSLSVAGWRVSVSMCMYLYLYWNAACVSQSTIPAKFAFHQFIVVIILEGTLCLCWSCAPTTPGDFLPRLFLGSEVNPKTSYGIIPHHPSSSLIIILIHPIFITFYITIDEHSPKDFSKTHLCL